MIRGSTTRAVRRLARLGAPLAAVALVLAACGGSSATPATTDPYEIAVRAIHAPMDQVQVEVGIKTSGTASDVTIDPGAIQIVADTKAGKASVHLSLPASALGSDLAPLAAMGGSSGTIDLDVLYDGQALYAKSPLAATLLPMLMSQSGQTISGDLTGWLRLGTAEDFASLAGGLGGLPGASGSPGASASPNLASLDATQLKTQLDDSGVTLTYAGSESHNGANADHLTATVDQTKLSSGPLASQLPSQLGQVEGLVGSQTLTADLWLDQSSGRLTELDLHGAGSDGSTTDVTVLVSVPGSAAFDAPSSYTDVPIVPLLTQLMQTFGGSLLPTP
jgi:hypothetical protein